MFMRELLRCVFWPCRSGRSPLFRCTTRYVALYTGWERPFHADDGVPFVGVHVPLADIRNAFEPLAQQYPPILSLGQAAEIAKLAPGTLKRKVSEGAFNKSVKKGKPLRFWRDTFIQELMTE